MENEKQDEVLSRVISARQFIENGKPDAADELLKQIEGLYLTQEATPNVTPNLVPFDQLTENMNGTAVRGKLVYKREGATKDGEGNWFAFILQNEKNEQLRITAYDKNATRLYPILIPRNTYDITEVKFKMNTYNNIKAIEGTVSSLSEVIDVSNIVYIPDIYVKIKDIQNRSDVVNVKGQITNTIWKPFATKFGKKDICHLTIKDDTGQIDVQCWSHHDIAKDITQREGDIYVKILGAIVDNFRHKDYLNINDSAILTTVDNLLVEDSVRDTSFVMSQGSGTSQIGQSQPDIAKMLKDAENELNELRNKEEKRKKKIILLELLITYLRSRSH